MTNPDTTRPSTTPAPGTTPAPSTTSVPSTTPAGAPGVTSTPSPSATSRPRAPATRPRPARTRARTQRRAAPASAPPQLITGQLVASVHPIAPSAGAVVRPVANPTPAAAVGAATRVSSAAGWLAALAVVALLGLGAARERRGHGSRRRLSPPA